MRVRVRVTAHAQWLAVQQHLSRGPRGARVLGGARVRDRDRVRDRVRVGDRVRVKVRNRVRVRVSASNCVIQHEG